MFGEPERIAAGLFEEIDEDGSEMRSVGPVHRPFGVDAVRIGFIHGVGYCLDCSSNDAIG